MNQRYSTCIEIVKDKHNKGIAELTLGFWAKKVVVAPELFNINQNHHLNLNWVAQEYSFGPKQLHKCLWQWLALVTDLFLLYSLLLKVLMARFLQPLVVWLLFTIQYTLNNYQVQSNADIKQS